MNDTKDMLIAFGFGFLIGGLIVILVWCVNIENAPITKPLEEIIEHNCMQYNIKTGEPEWIKK